MKKAFYSLLFVSCIAFGNDFTTFEQDEHSGLGNVPSISDLQTRSALLNNEGNSHVKTYDVTQIELMRKANVQRNGWYVMFVHSWIPMQRIAPSGDRVRGYSVGFGARGGIISYLDSYIGIRGYFSLDINNDGLSPVDQQRTDFSGTFLMLGMGVDILVDFFIDRKYKNTAGFFIGVGGGAFTYFDFSRPVIIPNQASQKFVYGANITVQGGFSSVFAYRHRVEIGIRFLPTQSLTIDEDGIQADYNFYAGYSYKFGKR